MSLKQKVIAASILAAAAMASSGAAQAAPILQWASTVTGYSSQYNSSSWYATQVLGAPNRPTYGDLAGAWAPLRQNGTLEWISVGFDQAVYSTGAMIREVSGNGFVYQVDVVDTLGNLHKVWSGVDNSTDNMPFNFTLEWAKTDYLVKGLKVYVTTSLSSEWEEIDAIQLAGSDVPPTAQEVPEPAGLGILGLGMLALAAVRRRSR